MLYIVVSPFGLFLFIYKLKEFKEKGREVEVGNVICSNGFLVLTGNHLLKLLFIYRLLENLLLTVWK